MLKENKRQRLQTLARALSEEDKITVRLGDASRTDFGRIEIRDTEEIVPGVPASPVERWLALKAGTAHEAGHIIFTDRKAWQKAIEIPLLAHLLNIIEDARIEKAMANAYPGTLMWFRFLNTYVCRNRKDWGEGLEGFLSGLCAYAVAGVVPAALPAEIRGLINKCKPLVDQGREAADTWGALEQARGILDLIEGIFPQPSEPPFISMGTSNPREAPDGPLDPRPRRVTRRVREEPKPDEEPDTSGSEPREADKPDESGGERDDPDKPDPNDNSGDKPEDGPAEADPDKDGPDGSDEQSESSELDSPDAPDERSDPDGDPGESGSDDGSNESDDSDEINPEPDAPERGDNGPDADGDGSDESGDGDEAGPEESGGGQDQPEDEDTPEAPSGDSDLSPTGAPGGDSEPGEDPEPGEDEPEALDDEDFSALLEATERELSKMESESSRQEKEAARERVPEPDWEKLRADVSKDIHARCSFAWSELSPDPNYYQKLRLAQQGLIQRLTEEIRRALEFRATAPRRNLKKGRLDASSLWKLRVPDPRVFVKRDVPGDIPALAIYLLVDCSGSMSSVVASPLESRRRGLREAKIALARRAAVALHEVCVNLKITHRIAGFDSHYPRTKFYDAVKWGERDGSRIASLSAGEANRDGYAIRIAAKELAARPEPRKVLFVLSDGLPEDDRDGRYCLTPLAYADTAKAVREAERDGIGVIGLFFGSYDDRERAQTIYDQMVYVQDVSYLPLLLGRVLKKVITGGA